MANTVTDIQRRDYDGRQPMQIVQLTQEELKVWEDCMKNSSVAIPTLLSMAIGYGICKVTPFRAKANYFAMITGIVGLISNRISASKKCLLKVTSMPGSNLRERLREANLYNSNKSESLYYKGFQALDVQSQIQTSEPTTEIVFDDYPPMNTYDTYSSFNDSSNIQVSSEETDLTEPVNLQKNISYDELRHKNREEFYNKNKQWYTARGEQPTRTSEATSQVSRNQESSNNTLSVQQKNKYGDVWG